MGASSFVTVTRCGLKNAFPACQPDLELAKLGEAQGEVGSHTSVVVAVAVPPAGHPSQFPLPVTQSVCQSVSLSTDFQPTNGGCKDITPKFKCGKWEC